MWGGFIVWGQGGWQGGLVDSGLAFGGWWVLFFGRGGVRVGWGGLGLGLRWGETEEIVCVHAGAVKVNGSPDACFR